MFERGHVGIFVEMLAWLSCEVLERNHPVQLELTSAKWIKEKVLETSRDIESLQFYMSPCSESFQTRWWAHWAAVGTQQGNLVDYNLVWCLIIIDSDVRLCQAQTEKAQIVVTLIWMLLHGLLLHDKACSNWLSSDQISIVQRSDHLTSALRAFSCYGNLNLHAAPLREQKD